MSSPLAHQGKRASILSWWSDSNPGLQGPTINIHAAAKPLSRFLYRRQALDFIKENHGSPLSAPILEIYSSYLPWDYVSWSTKAAILSELARAARFSEVDAHAVVDSPVLSHVAKMLESPDSRTSAACELLGSLSRHTSTAPAVLDLNPCERLMSLLRDQVVCAAASALSDIANSADGALAVANAKALDHIWELLESPDTLILYQAWTLLESLASQPSASYLDTENLRATSVPLWQTLHKPGISDERYMGWFLAYGKDDDSKVVLEATVALYQIPRSQWGDGVKALADADLPEHFLLKSPDPHILKWACMLMGELARDESTVSAISELELCARLVSFLQNEESIIIHGTLYALAEIARSLDGAQAIVNAKALDRVFQFLKSTKHESTAPAIWQQHSLQLNWLSGNWLELELAE
ncbi:armadillo-type protein [Mycena galopus ATCC 62051]|nr:armadillo-type protein [Mycena galopus ATCC 62051]